MSLGVTHGTGEKEPRVAAEPPPHAISSGGPGTDYDTRQGQRPTVKVIENMGRRVATPQGVGLTPIKNLTPRQQVSHWWVSHIPIVWTGSVTSGQLWRTRRKE